MDEDLQRRQDGTLSASVGATSSPYVLPTVLPTTSKVSTATSSAATSPIGWFSSTFNKALVIGGGSVGLILIVTIIYCFWAHRRQRGRQVWGPTRELSRHQRGPSTDSSQVTLLSKKSALRSPARSVMPLTPASLSKHARMSPLQRPHGPCVAPTLYSDVCARSDSPWAMLESYPGDSRYLAARFNLAPPPPPAAASAAAAGSTPHSAWYGLYSPSSGWYREALSPEAKPCIQAQGVGSPHKHSPPHWRPFQADYHRMQDDQSSEASQRPWHFVSSPRKPSRNTPTVETASELESNIDPSVFGRRRPDGRRRRRHRGRGRADDGDTTVISGLSSWLNARPLWDRETDAG